MVPLSTPLFWLDNIFKHLIYIKDFFIRRVYRIKQCHNPNQVNFIGQFFVSLKNDFQDYMASLRFSCRHSKIRIYVYEEIKSSAEQIRTFSVVLSKGWTDFIEELGHLPTYPKFVCCVAPEKEENGEIMNVHSLSLFIYILLHFLGGRGGGLPIVEGPSSSICVFNARKWPSPV
jgi:hypothetical protein